MNPSRLAIATALAITLIGLGSAPSFAQDSRGDRLRVRVESEQPGLRLYYVHEGSEAGALCGAPCELRLRRGFHDLAVGTNGGPRVSVPLLSLETDSVLDIAYESHAIARTVGGIFSGLGIAVGLVGSIGGVMALAMGGDALAAPLGAAFLGGGSALLILGVIGAVAFGSWGDTARIEIRPLS